LPIDGVVILAFSLEVSSRVLLLGLFLPLVLCIKKTNIRISYKIKFKGMSKKKDKATSNAHTFGEYSSSSFELSHSSPCHVKE
jgi:hypothetical protein